MLIVFWTKPIYTRPGVRQRELCFLVWRPMSHSVHACRSKSEAIAVRVVGRWGGDGSLLAVPFARKGGTNGQVTRCGKLLAVLCSHRADHEIFGQLRSSHLEKGSGREETTAIFNVSVRQKQITGVCPNCHASATLMQQSDCLSETNKLRSRLIPASTQK